MNITDLPKVIDKVIDESIDKYSNVLISLTEKKIRDAVKEKDLGKAIAKIKPNNTLFSSGTFLFLDKDIDKLQKITNIALRRKIGEAVSSFERLYNVSIGRANFLNDIYSLVNATTSRIPSAIFNDVLDSAILTLTDAGTTSIAKDLSVKINKSLNKSKFLLKESLSIANREFQNQVFLKIEKEGDQYQYVGPVDKRKDDFCMNLINQVKTRAEWIRIKPDIFSNGGHPGCRDSFVLIPVDEVEKLKKKVDNG